ncbi:MAG TPA: hypothetical protein VF808_04425 [Ktedonobacterales bacterium]
MRSRTHTFALMLALISTLAVGLSGCGLLNAIGGSNTNYFPTNLARATPVAHTFQGCSASGQGGDPALNVLLNRTDDNPPDGYRQTDIATVIGLPTTPQVQNKPRSSWTADEASRVAKYEGVAVRTTGWVVASRHLGPDAANCDSTINRDWALWIGTGAGDAMSTTLVVLLTPQVLAQRPGWTAFSLRRIVGQVVRISGYMTYDQSPSPVVSANSATTWVIAPVIHLDVYYQNQWLNLDLIPFGPRTSGTPQASSTP